MVPRRRWRRLRLNGLTAGCEGGDKTERLLDFGLERELAREGGDLERAEQALAAIRARFATLKTSPFTSRKAGHSHFLRDLIIPFGRSGYVALFDIECASALVIAAMRHQPEEDFHWFNHRQGRRGADRAIDPRGR